MMSDLDGRERSDDDDDEKQSGAGDETGEDEGSSANDGDEGHLKDDQKTTSR